MFNDRPIEDPRLQAALNEVLAIYQRNDLAGAVILINDTEAAFAYALPTTWNAIISDDTLPQVAGYQSLGFRIRVKESELGRDRAHAFMEGTAHMLCQLADFGHQTRIWARDLLTMLKRHGVKITHVPFNGRKLPRITDQPGSGRP